MKPLTARLSAQRRRALHIGPPPRFVTRRCFPADVEPEQTQRWIRQVGDALQGRVPPGARLRVTAHDGWGQQGWPERGGPILTIEVEDRR